MIPPRPPNNNNNNTITISFCFLFRRVTDKKTFNDLRAALWNEGLDLDSIDDTSNQAPASMEGVLQIILIVVSVVLGTLVIVLFAAFFIRTRRWVLQSARYTGCPRRNGQNFGRVFLMLNYTDITQNTYIQS